MSGLSLAVRQCPDHESTAGSADEKTPAVASKRQGQAVVGGAMGSLRVIEIQLVAFVVVFSASGLVPLIDLAFPAFATLYVLALSRFAFPAVSSGGGRELFRGSRAFRAYVVAGTTVGLFLPLAYVLGGFARGGDHAVRAAAPHLFLLSCQILTENVVSGMEIFSPPVRAIVVLLYTVRRVFIIVDWIYIVWASKTPPLNASVDDVAWIWFGRVLSTANLLYFSINLFAFLIPRFLPTAFEKYFKEREEIHAKAVEDKKGD
ncbi:uncharacterized protein LOC122024986 [Zingiber officinale]|uniref:DUF7733 domain-containing protein n=1 Tax=Zingiber officinale TaxID=94328 RepID=A0A8J5EWR8_ZINOF|nr:uncharacterized protein LOC122024986 [Zingiber officinale]KAG6475311.1 hypothetical protein ZIOFF_064529 [Zingiber officinale]